MQPSNAAKLVSVLAFILGSAPKTASAAGLRRELSDVVDGALSGVCTPDDDYADRTCTAAREMHGLHVCPECGSLLVQPTRWEPTAKPGHWRIWRRCPQCKWRTDGIHGGHEVDAFRKALEGGDKLLAAQLKALEHDGIGDIVDPFAKALAADLITADDFNRRN